MLERERERVATTARRLSAEGLVVGTAGNVSERCADLVAVTPTGASLAELTAAEVAVVDLDGGHVDGEFAATSELELHLGVYRRYNAGGVVHTHAPIATALSCVLDELPVVHYSMIVFGGPVRVAPYATFGSPELAKVTLEALESRTAALLANHGAITIGADVEAAAEQSRLLEWACSLYWHAVAVGTPRTLDEDQRLDVAAAAIQRNYGSPQRRPG